MSTSGAAVARGRGERGVDLPARRDRAARRCPAGAACRRRWRRHRRRGRGFRWCAAAIREASMRSLRKMVLMRKAAAQGLLHQVFAFDRHQAAGEPGVAGKGGAQLLDAWVGAAGDDECGHSEILRCGAMRGTPRSQFRGGGASIGRRINCRSRPSTRQRYRCRHRRFAGPQSCLRIDGADTKIPPPCGQP